MINLKDITRIKEWGVRLLVGLFLTVTAAQAEQVTDIAGRKVEVPAKVERILLGEGCLFYAVALLEGKKPFKRIVGWQAQLAHFNRRFQQGTARSF